MVKDHISIGIHYIMGGEWCTTVGDIEPANQHKVKYSTCSTATITGGNRRTEHTKLRQ